MKRLLPFIFTLTLFFLGGYNAYAVCDATEMNRLNSLAVNVGVDYEIVELEIPVNEDVNPPDGLDADEEYIPRKDHFKFYITNITEELYVVVTNELTEEKRTFTFDDAENCVITFADMTTVDMVDYTFEIYSSSVTNCPDTLLYTWYETTPMRNLYSHSSFCIGIEEFYLCHDYLSVQVSFENLEELTREYREGHLNQDGEEVIVDEEEKDNGFMAFVEEHMTVIIIAAVIIVAAGGLITFVVIKKQRSRIV